MFEVFNMGIGFCYVVAPEAAAPTIAILQKHGRTAQRIGHAIADLEMQAADRIIQEVQTAAPGSAPILEAGAAAWLVRSNAYTQAALTELMRLRAIDLAAAGTEMKLDAQRGATLRGNVTDALKRK